MSEMHGDCANYATDVRTELDAMGKPGRPLTAAASRTHIFPVEATAQRLDVTLKPANQVTLALKPKREEPQHNSYAGFLLFQVWREGLYRISLDSPVRVDVLSGDMPIEASAFEMQTGCKRVFKTVQFRLKAGSYWLQMVGGKTPELRLVITEEPPRE